MARGCAACDGVVDPATGRCTDCGLANGGTAAWDDAPPPEHVGVYMGAVPHVAALPVDAPAGPASRERAPTPRESDPPRPKQPSRRLRPRTVVALAALVAIAVAVAVSLSRSWERRGSDTRRADLDALLVSFLDRPALAPWQLPETFDADAATERLAGTAPDVLAAARAAHVALPRPGSVPVHEWFAVFFERLHAVDPWFAVAAGVHPHRRVAERTDDDVLRARAATAVAIRDAYDVLRAWPGTLSDHDRLDVDALRAWCESELRAPWDRDQLEVRSLSMALDDVVILSTARCCAPDDRAAAAVASLRSLPADLRRSVDALEAPARPLLLAALRVLDDAPTWTLALADSWTELDAGSREKVRAAAVPAAAAIADAARRVRNDVLPRATGEMGIGRDAFGVLLSVGHGLPYDPRTAFEYALGVWRRACHDEDAAYAACERGWNPVSEVADVEAIDMLRRASSNWLPERLPHDDLRAVARPSIWGGVHAQALYVDGGTLAPRAGAAIVLEAPPTATKRSERDLALIRQRHALVHEAYPGHRMEALARASVCDVRRFLDDRVYVEGWATYAEDLAHETGQCAGGPFDDWVRADDRAGLAWAAMLEILCGTRAADAAELSRLTERDPDYPAAQAELGAAHIHPGYGARYLLGHTEIVRLRDAEMNRLGRAFDLRAFHARLLAERPVPTPWVGAQWAERSR